MSGLKSIVQNVYIIPKLKNKTEWQWANNLVSPCSTENMIQHLHLCSATWSKHPYNLSVNPACCHDTTTGTVLFFSQWSELNWWLQVSVHQSTVHVLLQAEWAPQTNYEVLHWTSCHLMHMSHFRALITWDTQNTTTSCIPRWQNHQDKKWQRWVRRIFLKGKWRWGWWLLMSLLKTSTLNKTNWMSSLALNYVHTISG